MLISASSLAHRIGQGNSPPGHVGVQAFDHLAVDRHDIEVSVFRSVEFGDDLAGLVDFLGRWRENLVTDGNLARMDQRLAVHAQFKAVLAFGDWRNFIHRPADA